MKKVKIFPLALIMAAGFLYGAFGVLRPGAAAASGVVFEVDADTPVVPAGESRSVTVRALVRPDGGAVRKRIPLAVALVLDQSGSMRSENRIENAKLGAMKALERLGAGDVATLVVYDSEASVKVPPMPASEKSVFSKAISGIRAGGSTALYDGVRLGAEQILPFVNDGYVPRIILLSDGIANVGPSSTRELANLGRTLAEREMTITTIGLGLDYNEDLMTALAAESGGNAYFARRAESLSDIFTRDMMDATSLTARRVRVTLTCASGVRPIGAIGRKGSPKGGTAIEVYIDNLYGDEKYALFEIEITAAENPEKTAVLDAATLKLEYLDPTTDSVVVMEAPLTLTLAADAGEVEKNRRDDVVVQAAIARNAEIREEAVRLADEGRSDEAARVLRTRAESLAAMAPSPMAMEPEIKSEVEDLEALSAVLLEEKNMSSEQRKNVLFQIYRQQNQQAPVPEKRENVE
ncbi:MAG: VWA domain-containing protein [Synergistaceae bacterium]|nr:VWA domain-containing protein [Synergistaceae bacterium]